MCNTCMCMHARMRRLVWSGDGTYVRRRRPWPARGKICACAFLVMTYCVLLYLEFHSKACRCTTTICRVLNTSLRELFTSPLKTSLECYIDVNIHIAE